MTKMSLVICCLLMLAVGAAPVLAAHGEEHTFTLSTLNGSGVTGEGTIEFDADNMTTNVEAGGLTPDRVHEIHIHGKSGQDVSCPTGTVDHEKMKAIVGGHVLDLEPFPTADADGDISLERTYTERSEALAPTENRVVAVHGMNMGGEYMVDMPVACGEIELAGGEVSFISKTGGSDLGQIWMPLSIGALAAGVIILSMVIWITRS